jgi:transposase
MQVDWAVIQGDQNAFLAFSGVPHEVLYDNMRRAVVLVPEATG